MPGAVPDGRVSCDRSDEQTAASRMARHSRDALLSLPVRLYQLLRHVYHVLLNRHSFFGLLREIAVNMTFILLWICTFKNARLIDPSIRPQIHVKLLEKRDHQLFDLTPMGVTLQLVIAFYGALWVYVLTGKPRWAGLGVLPPFLLNALYTGTHELSAILDVCAWLSYGVIHFVSPFLCAFWLCRSFPLLPFRSGAARGCGKTLHFLSG